MTTNSSPFERNRDPILEKLEPLIPRGSQILEIGSGTGDHSHYFAEKLPGRFWQCSEGEAHFEALCVTVSDRAHPALKKPIPADLYDTDWYASFSDQSFDLVMAINVIHIAAWGATPSLMEGAAQRLKENGYLLLYGPYRYTAQALEPSNEQFDQWLKKNHPGGGLRIMEEVVGLAEQQGLHFIVDHPMPVNNHVLIFQKR